MYTLEVQTRSINEIASKVVGRFSVSAANALWEELGVSDRRWTEWHDAVQRAQQGIALVPSLPQISRLAYIDEGSVHFVAKDLSEECARILPIAKGDATRHLIEELLEAANSALLDENANVVVHPFGG